MGIVSWKAFLCDPLKKIYMDMQPGDVPKTYADTAQLEAAVGYKPSTSIQEGMARFVEWYKYFQEELKSQRP